MKYFKVTEGKVTIAWSTASYELAWGMVQIYMNDDQACQNIDGKIEICSDGNIYILDIEQVVEAFNIIDIDAEEISEQEWEKFEPNGKTKFVRFVKDWGGLQY